MYIHPINHSKSFARIHAANLINAGILPLTFANADDYDKLSEGDKLCIEGLFDALESGTATLKKADGSLEIPLVCAFTERQKAILKCGGLLPYTKTV